MPKKARKSSARSDGANGAEDRLQAGPRPFWSGTISFGLVSVPVNLFPASKTSRAPLRMLGPEGEPLARKYYSEKTGKDLDADETIRGYEVDDKFVTVTDEELERLAPERTRDINLKLFVKKESISPLYFDRGYFLAPGEGSEKAYKLLVEAMTERDDAGVATFVMRGKEYPVAIIPDDGILRAETMRFPDEVRSPEKIGLPGRKKKIPAASVRKFETLIKKKKKKQFKPDKDENTERLLKLVKKKQSSRKNIVEVESEETDSSNVIDLMQVLKKSLAGKAAAR
ncbi:MAG TPA: Ku protein [Pyrinomonadaceae bacterium]|nr:Ku protein [Pyrinomonadaceae bacterium]